MWVMYLCGMDLKTLSKRLRWAAFPVVDETGFPDALWCAPAGTGAVELYYRLTPALYRLLHNTLARSEEKAKGDRKLREELVDAKINFAPLAEFAQEELSGWEECATGWTPPTPERSKNVVEAFGAYQWPETRLDGLALAYERQRAELGMAGGGVAGALAGHHPPTPTGLLAGLAATAADEEQLTESEEFAQDADNYNAEVPY